MTVCWMTPGGDDYFLESGHVNSPELAPFAAATEKVLTDNADTYGDLLDQLKAWKEAR